MTFPHISLFHSDWKEAHAVKYLTQTCSTRWPNSQPPVYESCAALLHHMCIMIQTYFEILKKVIKVLTPVLWCCLFVHFILKEVIKGLFISFWRKLLKVLWCCLFVHFQWSNFTSCNDLKHTQTSQFELILLTTYSQVINLFTQVSSAEKCSNFFFFQNFRCHFWIQFIRYIQMSANKPSIGPVALDVTLWNILIFKTFKHLN